jgi:hypothetical protein
VKVGTWSIAAVLLVSAGCWVISPGDVVRDDTRLDFGEEAAWERFDPQDLETTATMFSGGAFDGRHVYLLPGMNTVIARFDAQNPSEMPAAFYGSFF